MASSGSSGSPPAGGDGPGASRQSDWRPPPTGGEGQPARPPGERGPSATRAEGDGESIDWIAAERSPEFRELVSKRRAFVLPATIFFFVWYFGFIVLAGYAPGFMGTSIYEGFTVGYLVALTQFVMVWALGAAYLRRSAGTFDPLAARAAQTAVEAGRRGTPATGQGTRTPGGAAGATSVRAQPPGEGGLR
jgi:uncharacterized membrane protein (DUF485 family)